MSTTTATPASLPVTHNNSEASNKTPRPQSANSKKVPFRTTSKKTLVSQPSIGGSSVGIKSKIPKNVTAKEDGKPVASVKKEETESSGQDQQPLKRRPIGTRNHLQPQPQQQQQQPQTNNLSSSSNTSCRSQRPKYHPNAASTSTIATTSGSIGSASGSASGQKRVLENLFKSRKFNYVSLKAEIEDKQKSSESAYEELLALRDKIIAAGGRAPKDLEELAPVPAWTAQQLKHQQQQQTDSEQKDGDETKDEEDADFAAKLEASLRGSIDCLLEFCNEALEKRSDALARLVELSEGATASVAAGDEPGRSLERLKGELCEHVESYSSDSSDLEAKLEETRQEQYGRVAEVVRRVSCFWHELRAKRDQQEKLKANGSEPSTNDETAQLTHQLRQEKDRGLRARARIRELESALSNSETKLRQTQETLKQKEALCEQKVKELARHQKTGEHKLDKKKEALEGKLNKMKEQLDLKEKEVKDAVAKYERRVADLQRDLENEKCARQEIEAEYEEFKVRNERMEEKCQRLLEKMQERGTKQDSEQHTEYEVKLFNDLKEARKLLSDREELIKKLQAERDEIIASVNEEADVEDNASKRKLTAELLRKSNELQAMTSEYARLQKSCKKAQQHVERLENSLAEVQKQQQHNPELYPGDLNQHQQQQQHHHHHLYGTLEAKEAQVCRLEKLLKQMEKQEEYSQQQRTRLEGRIAKLELALKESQLAHRNRGFSFL